MYNLFQLKINNFQLKNKYFTVPYENEISSVPMLEFSYSKSLKNRNLFHL